jgi:hypothetical protein
MRFIRRTDFDRSFEIDLCRNTRLACVGGGDNFNPQFVGHMGTLVQFSNGRRHDLVRSSASFADQMGASSKARLATSPTRSGGRRLQRS